VRTSRGPRPTLEAVAAHAGVSRATVSRVVNGGAGVRAEVAEKVRQSVQQLGYVPNNAARTLVTRRTGAVAVVIAEPESRVFADPFFAQQLRGISRELAEHDYQLLLMMLEHSRDYDRIGRYLSGGHVDGALMFSLHGYDPPPGFARDEPAPGPTGEVRPRATVFGLPTVFGGRPGWPGAATDPELLYVDSDNRDGARQAVSHLLQRGRKKIAVITGPLDQTSALDRLHGYVDALGLSPGSEDPSLVADGGFTVEGGEHAMAQLLDSSPDLDAVFAGNDLMASGALRTLRERGRSVPGDVAVVGYDDSEPAAWAQPALTTVRQDVEGMGRIMARLLVRRLAVSAATGTGAGASTGAGPGNGTGTGTGTATSTATGTGNGAVREPGRRLGPVVTSAQLVVRDSS
jgi:DNA-binding LacI/PurR family transcriptional regulator